MTTLLAIETATPRCSVALGSEDGVLASSSVDGDRRHVEALVPAIAAACRTAGLALEDVDAVAVDVGPGLFTGMRVGIATAQGLALALGLRVHPVLSLDALAHSFRHANRPVAAVVDARRGEVFRSLHRSGVAIAAPTCCTPEALAAELADLSLSGSSERETAGLSGLAEQEMAGSSLAVGDGAARHRALLEAVAGVEVVAAMPVAESVLELALAAMAGGAAGLDPAEVQALYLRTPDARANFAVLAGGVG